jgi:hypothetical protein
MNLQHLLADEPPYVLDPDGALRSGRRLRRRRRVALGVVGVAIAGSAVALVGGPADPHDTVGFAEAPTAQDSGDLDNPYYRIARAHTPAGWVIAKAHVDGEGMWADVTDDRGDGPGRLGLFISRGGLQQHPCSDPEFVAKAVSCTETQLDADTRLVVRSASRTDPVKDVQVGIIHANGDGAYASDDNATWPDLPPGTVITTEAQKRALTKGTVGSTEPVYAVEDLIAMAKDLDALRISG